ncbi:protein phosphatase regulator [Coniosporium apollinis]|uniref:Protein phosphatase regulator n=1 Tax=Coniosporium apollinis TaxID=61459 RepID=A0ABQ9NSK2_9PEZI|nr:protein phosphatase regulator [Coniosporium apollinis]
MTRPHIIRADTIDLQDHHSPSAKDHTRQPTQPAPLGIGAPAPHHAAAVRHVQAERTSEEEHLSQAWADAQHVLRDSPEPDDDLSHRVNGDHEYHHEDQSPKKNDDGFGGPGEVDITDAESDDALDDDMMGQISSSPSISDEDHHQRDKYILAKTSFESEITQRDNEDSMDHPTHLFPGSKSRPSTPMSLDQELEELQEHSDLVDNEDLHSLLLPEDDPLLDNSFDSADDAHAASTVPCPASRSPSPNDSVDASPTDSVDDKDADSWTTDSDASSWDEESCNDDDPADLSFSSDPRFVDFGWGGECLRETEDIDFEFVYALHNFVATVEGQANATKGDTMVLLDDSNSYWWLVRIVKDSSIGYLPAEHIETPTERLARLNKHRNIDLSATMLSDNAEKSKNPLKKAMRRRNAKTVTFTAPTYVEASDYDYSSDEESDEARPITNGDVHAAKQQNGESVDQDKISAVEPLKANGKGDTDMEVTARTGNREDEVQGRRRASDEMFDRLDAKVSRNGTVRNTDSFFKDDNVETRKITLTPNLLRDDSSTSTVSSKERMSSSLESLEKDRVSVKAKDDKKKKEKKPGMLSGLFKKKDKKTKNHDTESSDEKRSGESGRSSPQSSKASEESLLAERTLSLDSGNGQPPSRQGSKGKLQKPHGDTSPQETKPEAEVTSPQKANSTSTTSDGTADATMRLVTPEPEQAVEEPAPLKAVSPQSKHAHQLSGGMRKLNPIHVLRTSDPEGMKVKREKLKKAKQRMELDIDSSPDVERLEEDPFADHMEGRKSHEHESTATEVAAERLSDSPVHVSPIDVEHLEADASQPPALVGDTSSQEDQELSPVSPSITPPLHETISTEPPPASAAASSTAIPENSRSAIPPAPARPAPIPRTASAASDAPRSASATAHNQLTPTSPLFASKGKTPSPAPPSPSSPNTLSPTTSNPSTLPPWSDASLRHYLDDGSDIRDMLIVVNDVSGVVPVGPGHPLMAGLWVEERGKLGVLERELDGLLGGWLERKRGRGPLRQQSITGAEGKSG